MLNFLSSLFLQISDFACSDNDKEKLEYLQWKIQERIRHLQENQLDANNDETLFEYYELHRLLQNCIAQNPDDNIAILTIMIIVVPCVIVFTAFMVRKVRKLERRRDI